MKGTPEQIRRATAIKSEAIDRIFKMIKNKKTIDLIIQFADSKQDANWWLLKSMSGENFLITEHQKTISSYLPMDNNVCYQKDEPDYLKKIRLVDFQLPKWIVAWLKEYGGDDGDDDELDGNKLIEEALIQTYQIKPPMEKDSS